MNDSFLQMFLIYLFYGAAFFAIGVAIISRLSTFAFLRIAGIFWLLALFAFSHAMHEWLEMFLYLEPDHYLALPIRRLSLLLLAGSFIFLLFFGINFHSLLNQRLMPWLWGLPVVSTAIFFLLLSNHAALPVEAFLNVVDYSSRKCYALPASLLSGSAFLLYANRQRSLSRKGAGNLAGAGLAFIAYGILAGLIPSDNQLGAMPIQFWRGLTAFIILHFIMYALDLFSQERDSLINSQLQRAAQADKLEAIGRLAAGIAHEINNPLANASLQLELLKQDPTVAFLPEKSCQRVKNITSSVDKSAKIASELLHLVDQRQEITTYEPVTIRPLVETVWRELNGISEKHGLDNLLPASLTIYGLPLKLEQLFRNLLANALDAMPGGGVISIAGRQEGDQVIVELQDEGGGIEENHQLLAKEPFFTTKEVGKGTGLGLAICHGIMAQHNGTLEIESRRDRQGTVVTLFFSPTAIKPVTSSIGNSAHERARPHSGSR
ncbi:sensor histidine kinase [Desulfurivibrio alkaliphilus]|uniref:histidine kinase n=1 Tax=Desulfurivibrio alkaliphilus (strain DSM 19089 / UNIQEM U267 / AHT2) TaxID=589865 RepID=D6Z5N2_DESAT|nr:HAMP domain-containing sensor histidine kinase [Desulfurivibrio alkaliphilus]ADH86769.1 integral membrane sensor signal transduction histidine kinase [Desulfurivibrio alkaliphilus AHT 2]